jgi:putative ABC transport system permease protein
VPGWGRPPLQTPATAGISHPGRQTNTEANHLATGPVLAFTAIAVGNPLAMPVAERVREFAPLRLAGAPRRQVLRMLLRAEALSVLFLATALGTGVALAVLPCSASA